MYSDNRHPFCRLPSSKSRPAHGLAKPPVLEIRHEVVEFSPSLVAGQPTPKTWYPSDMRSILLLNLSWKAGIIRDLKTLFLILIRKTMGNIDDCSFKEYIGEQKKRFIRITIIDI